MDTLKQGMVGYQVAELQQLLNRHGQRVVADGDYGDKTVAAVQAIQRRAGLVVDGRAGPKTLAYLRGQIPDEIVFLSEADLQHAAKALDVDLAAVKAVNLVESVGCGFGQDQRPRILLERHVAYKQAVAAGMDGKQLATRYPNLVNTKRGGYTGGSHEWSRFAQLVSVTSQAIAIEACSWGAFQIMGYHWAALGYGSAADFMAAMCRSEAEQLAAFVRFIQADPKLHQALAARNWDDFARRYNGPAYRDNLYDSKLATAYQRFSRQQDKAA